MIPDYALVSDRDGDLWTCVDGRWYCATQGDTHGVAEAELLEACGPLDVHVWRNRIELKDKQ